MFIALLEKPSRKQPSNGVHGIPTGNESSPWTGIINIHIHIRQAHNYCMQYEERLCKHNTLL